MKTEKETLAPEVLLQIFSHSLPSYLDLLSFSLVNRDWKGPALATLYRNIRIKWRFSVVSILLGALTNQPGVARSALSLEITPLDDGDLRKRVAEKFDQSKEWAAVQREVRTSPETAGVGVQLPKSQDLKTIRRNRIDQLLAADCDQVWRRDIEEQLRTMIALLQQLPSLQNLGLRGFRISTRLYETITNLPWVDANDAFHSLRSISLNMVDNHLSSILFSHAINLESLELVQPIGGNRIIRLPRLRHLVTTVSLSDFRLGEVATTLRTLDIIMKIGTLELEGYYKFTPIPRFPLLTHLRLDLHQGSVFLRPTSFRFLMQLSPTLHHLTLLSPPSVQSIFGLIPITLHTLEIEFAEVMVRHLADLKEEVLIAVAQSVHFPTLRLIRLSEKDIETPVGEFEKEIEEMEKRGVKLVVRKNGLDLPRRMIDLWEGARGERG